MRCDEAVAAQHARRDSKTCQTGLVAGLCIFPLAASALVLFDPAVGMPAAQGWVPLIDATPGAAGLLADRYTLDTRGAGVSLHGHARIAPVPLDPAGGYIVDFRARIVAETHASDNRAGFSMLFVGSNTAQSIEIGFWNGEVWAYDYVVGSSDRFVKGPSTAWNTGIALSDYRLRVQDGAFSLWSGGSLLIGGPLQDYTAQGAPYTVSNFVFFGDNTSRGSASVEVGTISLLPIPEPGPAALLALGLAAVGWRCRQRRTALTPG